MISREDQITIDKQIDIAISRYAFNMPRSLAKAKAKEIVHEAMRSYNRQTKLSTYISSKLQKLSRISYERSSVFNVPENRNILKPKIKDYMEEYKDNYGVDAPDHKITQKFSITKKELHKVKELINSGVSNPDVEFKKRNTINISDSDRLKEIKEPIKGIAADMFSNNKTESYIKNKYGIKKTTFYKHKKNMIDQLRRRSESEYIDYN
jgi:DNA-directed RNA polymerase specialized sigma subunit